jgi:hypothetical protein
MAAMSILRLVAAFLGSLFKSERQLVLGNLALKQQMTMRRQSMKRPRATPADRMFWILFSHYVEGWRNTLHALHPDTVVRWHPTARPGCNLRQKRFGDGSVARVLKK